MATGDTALYRERTAASIPSKYETILHLGAREKNGFGGRTMRFNDSDNERPGPGSYNTGDRSLVKQSDSFSKKGYGAGFASKTERFSYAPLQMNMSQLAVPGPGEYNQLAGTFENQLRVAPKGTSSFAKKVATTSNKHATIAPGPGSYQLAKPPTPKGGGAAFKSKTNRPRLGMAHDIPPPDIPGPGTYANPEFHHPDTITVAPSSIFKSSAPRLPGDKKYQPRTMEEKLELVPRKLTPTIPGPGTYQPEVPDPAAAIHAKESSAFRVGEVDRFGVPIKRKSRAVSAIPGPGTYDLSGKREPPAPVSSSFFMSNSSRFDGIPVAGAREPEDEFEVAPKPPGPAYYNPDPIPKKSFHLNSGKRWL